MKFSTAAFLMMGAAPGAFGVQREDIHRSLLPFFGDSDDEQRLLLRTQGCFYKCVELELSGEDCKQLIQGELGHDLSGHEMPLEGIKIHSPRTCTPEASVATSNFLGISTNIDGEVLCSVNEGVQRFGNFLWVTTDGDFIIPDVPCAGLDAVQCCANIKDVMVSDGIPLVDVNGRCLSCWVNQEPLEPTMGAEGVAGMVYKHHYFDGEVCTSSEMTQAHVDTQDTDQESILQVIANRLNTNAMTGATCDEMKALQTELMFEARSLPGAMTHIADLLCGYCQTDCKYQVQPKDLKAKLKRIATEIGVGIKSTENWVIIYTDEAGQVVEPPHIGGGHAELDYNRDDLDCETDAAETVSSPVDIRLAECGAANMQDRNCGTCRECLKDTCGQEWDNTYCVELLNGNHGRMNADEWLACLESNGQNDNLDTTIVRNIDNKYYYLRSSLWAPCTRSCDAQCRKTKDLDERVGECGAVNMANSDCTLCRDCIKEECTAWEWVGENTNDAYCWRLLNGQVKAFSDKWLACLESNAANNNLADYENNHDLLSWDFGRRDDTWAPCARNCDAQCVETETQDPRWKECSSQNIAETDCVNCRDCLKQNCVFGVEGSFCNDVLNGKRLTGENQWLACLESNGKTHAIHRIDRDDELITRDRLHVDYGRKETWAECGRKCDESCLKNDVGDPDQGRCGAKEIAGEFCEDCRACVTEKCDAWTDWLCAEALAGQAAATTHEWLACLESSGSSNELQKRPDGLGRDQLSVDYGRSGTWGACAQECDDRCYQKEPSASPPVGQPLAPPVGQPLAPICTAVELAHETGRGGTCETCRECLQRECFYFRDKCEQLIEGVVKGTPVEWTRCLETCGSGLPLDNSHLRSRQLFTAITNDGLGTPRSTWCECARSCDDSCNVQVALAPAAPAYCWGDSGNWEATGY